MGVLRMSARAPAAVAILLAVATGCTNPSVPEMRPESQVVLYGVLRVGTNTAAVMIEEWPEQGGRAPLVGAQVRLTLPDGTLLDLPENRATGPGCLIDAVSGRPLASEPGCYSAALPVPIGPLEAYALEARLPDGRVVTGSTRTPAPPTVTPAVDTVSVSFRQTPDRFAIGRVNLTASAAAGAERVDIKPTLASVTENGTTVVPVDCSVRTHVDPFRSPELLATRELRIFGVVCGGWQTATLRLYATGYDRGYAAYLEHMIEGTSVSAPQAAFGITGAMGVFGSAATTSLSLVVAYSPSP